jgi:hypothetical protein
MPSQRVGNAMEIQMYIGLGTILVIVVIVLLLR